MHPATCVSNIKTSCVKFTLPGWRTCWTLLSVLPPQRVPQHRDEVWRAVWSGFIGRGGILCSRPLSRTAPLWLAAMACLQRHALVVPAPSEPAMRFIPCSRRLARRHRLSCSARLFSVASPICRSLKAAAATRCACESAGSQPYARTRPLARPEDGQRQRRPGAAATAAGGAAGSSSVWRGAHCGAVGPAGLGSRGFCPQGGSCCCSFNACLPIHQAVPLLRCCAAHAMLVLLLQEHAQEHAHAVSYA